MALHPLELEMAAEELLVKQSYLTTMAADIQTAFGSLTEESDVATIAAAHTEYESQRQDYSNLGGIRLPILTNSDLFTAIQAEASS